MIGYALRHLLALLAFKNPWMLIADRLGWLRRPYRLRSWKQQVVNVRPRTGDMYAAIETFGMGCYSQATLRPGDTVIDVGANIGCVTVYAASEVGHTGRVFAFEPELATFDRLKENVSSFAQVVPLRQAVTDTSGEIEITVPVGQYLFTSAYEEVGGRLIRGVKQRVPAVTLDAFITQQGISRVNLLKLDCEGAEHAIVRHMDQATADKIEQIIAEIHNVPGEHSIATIKRLVELGFTHVYGPTHYFYR